MNHSIFVHWQWMHHTAFLVVAIIAILIQGSLVLLALFGPVLPYKIRKYTMTPIDSEEFLQFLGTISDAPVHEQTRVTVLTNGEQFYQAELDAIRAAKRSVNLEAYIFQRGEVTRRFVEAMAERAWAGVPVKIVLDAIGSFATTSGYFREVTQAGGRVEWYHPLRWDTWPRVNNRTHRELIIIDGEVGFIGGAGFADQWLTGKSGNPPWRDTMFRVDGHAVAGLQSVFAENWLQSAGEILTGREYFPFHGVAGPIQALVINSSPSGGTTRARILFQTLLASAAETIHIATPYFLPDKSAREEIQRAIQQRGVEVKIITPGRHSDHTLTRRSSRQLYGDLLQAGARIYEYQPAMLHAKVMIVDGLWSVVGSTNFDHRSFDLNDEVNLAACDAGLAERLETDFVADLEQSRAVSYEEWRNRSALEKIEEWMGWPIRREQ